VPVPLTVELDADALAEAIAAKVRAVLSEEVQSPWLTKAEAIDYTRIRTGTFEEMAADGRLPSHGGKTKVFFRPELDAALLKL
jgi:hypothetical protein